MRLAVGRRRVPRGVTAPDCRAEMGYPVAMGCPVERNFQVEEACLREKNCRVEESRLADCCSGSTAERSAALRVLRSECSGCWVYSDYSAAAAAGCLRSIPRSQLSRPARHTPDLGIGCGKGCILKQLLILLACA